MKLVAEVYRLQQTFPKYETYALCDQLRRAVVSIPANIAEGNARKHEKERVQFLHVSLGSLAEVDTLIDVAVTLSYIETRPVIIDELTESIGKMLSGLIRPSTIDHRQSNVNDKLS